MIPKVTILVGPVGGSGLGLMLVPAPLTTTVKLQLLIELTFPFASVILPVAVKVPGVL